MGGHRLRIVLSLAASLTVAFVATPVVTMAAPGSHAGGASLKHRVHVQSLPAASHRHTPGISAKPSDPAPDLGPTGPAAPVAGRAGQPVAGPHAGSLPAPGADTSASPTGRTDPSLAELDEFTAIGFDSISPPDTQMAVSAKGV